MLITNVRGGLHYGTSGKYNCLLVGKESPSLGVVTDVSFGASTVCFGTHSITVWPVLQYLESRMELSEIQLRCKHVLYFVIQWSEPTSRISTRWMHPGDQRRMQVAAP